MTNATQTAQALNVTGGTSYTIEAKTSDGRTIATLVRLSFETSDNVNEKQHGTINDLFNQFRNSVIDLF